MIDSYVNIRTYVTETFKSGGLKTHEQVKFELEDKLTSDTEEKAILEFEKKNYKESLLLYLNAAERYHEGEYVSRAYIGASAVSARLGIWTDTYLMSKKALEFAQTRKSKKLAQERIDIANKFRR